jgi:hypothetical protein
MGVGYASPNGFPDSGGGTKPRGRPETAAVIGEERAVIGPAQAVSLFQDRVELYRGKVARRGVDDLQYLGGRGLALQGFARLGD